MIAGSKVKARSCALNPNFQGFTEKIVPQAWHFIDSFGSWNAPQKHVSFSVFLC